MPSIHGQGNDSVMRASFMAWRRWLTKILRKSARGAGAMRPGLVDVAAFIRSPQEVVSAADPALAGRLSLVGAVAVAFGILLGGILGSLTGESTGAFVASAVWTVAWTAGRLPILQLMAPKSLYRDPRLAAAWAGGLLPYALGAWSPLRLLAFALSAWLTFRGLTGMVSRRDARVLVGIAFGLQVLGAVVIWVARSIALIGIYLLG